jgi:hypothetical protein
MATPNEEGPSSLDPMPLIPIQGTEDPLISTLVSQTEQEIAGNSGGTAGQHIPLSQPAKQDVGHSTSTDSQKKAQSNKLSTADTKGQHFPSTQLAKQVADNSRPLHHTLPFRA